MNNYKLVIQYDGTRYAGWQIQNNAETIQQKMVSAAGIILKENVTINGSGRTDSGVHALGQTANFRTEKQLDLYKFVYQLNALLPDDIAVISAEPVPEDFHARYDAKKRSYIYLISRGKDPFYNNYSWRISQDLSPAILNEISMNFLGKKDFSAFCRKQTETEKKICEVYDIHWRSSGSFTVFYISADRFLHGMVRTVIGTILDAQKQNDPSEFIQKIFSLRDREQAGEAVPAKGLFLYKVKYEN